MIDSDKRIENYLSCVLEANKNINLTGIKSFEKARILHIEDSLSALQEIVNAPSGAYADLGTGGGFPGVPLAIKTQRQTLLVDSSKKKIATIDAILHQLDLSDKIQTYADRIEKLAQEKGEYFSVLTARALAQLPSILELASPLLQKGGLLICYKAQLDTKELDAAKQIESLVGMKLISTRQITLSDEKTHREILVFEKANSSKITLPRKIGMAQKKPLCVEQ